MREPQKVTLCFTVKPKERVDFNRISLDEIQNLKTFGDGEVVRPDPVKFSKLKDLEYETQLTPGDTISSSANHYLELVYINASVMAVVSETIRKSNGKVVIQDNASDVNSIRYIIDETSQSRFVIDVVDEFDYTADQIVNVLQIKRADLSVPNGVDLPLYPNGVLLQHYKGGVYRITDQPGLNIISNSRKHAYGYTRIYSPDETKLEKSTKFWREVEEIEDTNKYKIIVL